MFSVHTFMLSYRISMKDSREDREVNDANRVDRYRTGG